MQKRNIMAKIWSYISAFLAGIIAGIVVFVKYLDGAEVQTTIQIKKLKSKNNKGGGNIIPNIDLEKQDLDTGEKKEKKGFLKGLFKRKKNGNSNA